MPDASRLPARPSLEQLRKQAKERLKKLRATDPAATLADAQLALAREYGFDSWPKLVHHVDSVAPPSAPAETLFYRINRETGTIEVQGPLSDAHWDTVVSVIKEQHLTGLSAPGITDAALGRVSRVDQLTQLAIGSPLLTDQGVAHLASLPQLEDLDLSGTNSRVTDRGLETLRHLPALTRFQMCWGPGISDAGAANLSFCDELEKVNLMGTFTGDGAINALRGKRRLRHFSTGRMVTDAGLRLLHDFPVFEEWQGGETRYDLMSFEAEPNGLLLDGPFTNQGLAALAGLDGLFGLNFFWHCPALTGEGLAVLPSMANLGFLGCHVARDADEGMRHIAAIPRLRMLMAQGTVATDDGFAALSRSQTLEHLWGRECPNLGSRGFTALAHMPALRGLGVSCKNVDDAALSALPRFPALKQLMSMDIRDDGFRHVGACTQLENLWCMYCRDTGDLATGHLAGLSRLKTYYAGMTQITDRSLEVLGKLHALEKLEFWQTAGVTDAGLPFLATLPRLREISLEGLPRVTRIGVAVFPASVRVSYSG